LLESFAAFGKPDQRRFTKALELLDADERHPSLRVHQLTGDLAGFGSASASADLRLLFLRGPAEQKIVVRCSRHYA
jgi:mRNA-degrading endonuclease YafQ of YafQ-DinJ toxin-antitoxin module